MNEHHHDYKPGWTNLKGQQKPDYLMDAYQNQDDAHASYLKLKEDEASREFIQHARQTMLESDSEVLKALTLWATEKVCPCPGDPFSFWDIAGEVKLIQGEPDDSTEWVEKCSLCHKEIL